MPRNPLAIPAMPDSAAGHSSPASVHPQVRSALSSPGQPLDPEFRAAIEPRFGREFGDVRVHTDSAASESAHALGAQAYTAGIHLVFGRNRYAPDTVSGRRLLIHELAHVAQQGHRSAPPESDWRIGSASSPAEHSADSALHAIESPVTLGQRVPQLAGLAPAEPTLHRAVATWGGSWDTTKYDVHDTGGVKDGVDIEVHFKPGPPVDATMIGIVQKAVSKKAGATALPDATTRARAVQSGANEGALIDQLAGFRNPLYATGAAKTANDKLWDTETHAAWGQHGFHHVDAKGVVHERDAILKDTPQITPVEPNSQQVFEDTALAVTGAQAGATYGSVQWGWKTDAAGKFTKLPLSLISATVPSGSFKEAQAQWNRSKDSAGNDDIRFFTASERFVQANDVPMVSDPADAAKTELAKLPQNTRVEVIDHGFGQKFNYAKPGPFWFKVTVTDGPNVGKTGWVQSSQLGVAKVKAGPANAAP